MSSILFIPGLLNDAELFRDQLGYLSARFDCHVADITQAGSLEDMAQAALERAPKRFTLVGFSLGGFVAQEILRQAPKRVERLALLNTACRVDSARRQESRDATNRLARQPGRFLGIGEGLLKSYFHPDNMKKPALTERVRDMTKRLGADVLVRQNSIQRRDGETVLQGFRGPTLVLCGENDAITSVSDHMEMASFIPFADLVILSRAGHMTPIERPMGVATAIEALMARDI